jgi:hypothetical protein
MLRKTTLLWILVTIPAMTAIAMQKDVLLKGLDTNKTVTLVVDGAERPLGVVGSAGDISIALDANLDAALDPNKNYVVYKDSCSRYAIFVKDSDDEDDCRRKNKSAKADDPCGRCVPVALILKGQVRAHPDAPSSSGTAAPSVAGSTGFSLGAFGFASSNQTIIINADTGVPIIDGRFDESGYNRPRVIRIDEKGSGLGGGGGVNLAWAQFPLGFRVGVAHEQDRSSPTEIVNGQRDLNGLIFDQSGNARLGSTTLFFGPTVNLGAGLFLTGGPVFSWWDVELSQTGSLRALCPNPCVVVNTDDVSEKVDGTDVGFHFGADYYPGNKWLGFSVSVMRVTLKDVYDPTRALALPRDWKDVNVFIGGTIRTPGGNPLRLFR